MTLLDIIFWLLIALIAVLAFTIESGLSARHRTLVLSSIMSATLAAIYMMFLVEDTSKFGTGGAGAPAKKEKQKVQGGMAAGNGKGGLPEAEAGPEAGDGGGPAEPEQAAAPAPAVGSDGDAAMLDQPEGFRDCPACPLMIKVPSGDVIIGSPAGEPDRRPNEGPQKLVRIRQPLAVSRYEILYREFAAFVTATRYEASASCVINGKPDTSANWKEPRIRQPSEDHPVVCLSWQDATAYAGWLTQRTDRRYRLPAESEWEFVARSGTITPYWTGKTISPEQANFGTALGGTRIGGKFSSNGFQLFDTAGNVWEMVADCWSKDLSNVPASGVAELGIGDCARAPLKGGGWNSPAAELRTASRRPFSRTAADNTVGFRLIRELR